MKHRVAALVGMTGLALALLGPVVGPVGATEPASGPTRAVAVTTPRIINGNIVFRKATPWFVLLMIANRGGGTGMCGGTAISNRWIVTAAHCIERAEGNGMLKEVSRPGSATRDLVVVERKLSYAAVNPVSLPTAENLPARQRVRWKRIVVPGSYTHNWSTWPDTGLPVEIIRDDIALIQTVKPMKTKPLPYSAKRNFRNGGSLQVLGFGLQDSDNGNSVSEYLKIASVSDQSSSRANCGTWLAMHPSFDLATSICAGAADGADSCRGDSGGPLKTVGRRQALVGVVSWGPDCGGGTEAPGVYTRVSSYAKWIKKITRVRPQ
ncbi:MAG: trypsin-like serine protease [Candidatus Nanopelagicales bacterium]|nr:trypsin-like serine protease [Candidatus Nanopelagicales bacterium]